MIESAPINIPEFSLYEVLKNTAEKRADYVAYEYIYVTVKYSEFLRQVDDFALRLRSMGVGQSDRVAICLPNCPQALIAFYAVSKLGAVSVMVHPLSSAEEIEFYMNDSECKLAITLDRFADKFPALNDVFRTLIVTSPVDTLSFFVRAVYKAISKDARTTEFSRKDHILWRDAMKMDISGVSNEFPKVSTDDDAAILYTGGTTGRNKGAVHSSRTFNVTAFGMIELSGIYGTGDTMLAEMPMFHGFGLCTCIHLPICIGLKCILMPNFTLDSICKVITKRKVNFLAGVPSLYEKIIDNKILKDADLSGLTGIFCGGDSMSIESKARVDEFLRLHGCETRVRIGFGCTECLTATAITPKTKERPGSVGVPIPSMSYKIVVPDTTDECPDGEDGEMCICGPAVMSRYLNNPKETEMVLRTHDDGRVWLHTGDLGYIDDGFIFFKDRLKRIIITSGYNVYPSQIEEILSTHPLIKMSCVIGVPDAKRGTRVKAYVVLKDGNEPTEEVKKDISSFVKSKVSSYAKPREYEFKDGLPLTKLNKVDYRALEKENNPASKQ